MPGPRSYCAEPAATLARSAPGTSRAWLIDLTVLSGFDRLMRVDFFFGPGSRYSYLAATQLSRIAEETGAVFNWRPLYSGELIERAGATPRSPQDPVYRHRDAARWARRYGVAYAQPDGVCDWRRLAYACVAAAKLGAAEAFGYGVLRLIYAEGVTPTDGHLVELAESCGLQAEGLIATANTPETAAHHEANVADALAAGAFGVPTFVTEKGAVVWGQDRLPLLKDCILMGDVAT